MNAAMPAPIIAQNMVAGVCLAKSETTPFVIEAAKARIDETVLPITSLHAASWRSVPFDHVILPRRHFQQPSPNAYDAGILP